MRFELKNLTSHQVSIHPQIRVPPRGSEKVDELTVEIIKAKNQGLIQIVQVPDPITADEIPCCADVGGPVGDGTLEWGSVSW